MRPWVSSRAFPLLGWLGDMGALWPSLLWGLSRVRGVLAFPLSLLGIPGCVGAVPIGLGGLGVFFLSQELFKLSSPRIPARGICGCGCGHCPFRLTAFRTVSSVSGLPSCFSPVFFMAWLPLPWPLPGRSAPCRFGRLFNPLA